MNESSRRDRDSEVEKERERDRDSPNSFGCKGSSTFLQAISVRQTSDPLLAGCSGWPMVRTRCTVKHIRFLQWVLRVGVRQPPDPLLAGCWPVARPVNTAI
jgi:hypothetical protein